MTSMDFEVELNYYKMALIRKKEKVVLQSQNFSFSYIIAIFLYIQSLESHLDWNVKKPFFFSSHNLLFINIDCNNDYVVHIGF